jgi:RNA polymerase-associated protein RTF1
VDPVRPYVVEGNTLDQTLELRHGASVKAFQMDRISNAPFTDVRAPRAPSASHH